MEPAGRVGCNIRLIKLVSVSATLGGRATHGRAPMRRPHRYRRPNPDRRRALELLAGNREGCTKAMMRAHGFSIDMLLELVRAGLATTTRQRMAAGRQTDVARLRITAVGQRALARMSK